MAKKLKAIDTFKNDINYRDKIAHVETIPAKEAKFKKIDGLNDVLIKYLESNGIKLYCHQADAYEHSKNGENIIITTPTASGKTLAFNLPIMDTLIENDEATALYIYPAKALANDQLNVLKGLEKDLELNLNPNTYDGDTPKSKRASIRSSSRCVLTNPYQLHLILAWHHQWKKFYKNLKYIVIDESHFYKGVFGSNVAYLIKRLKRIANHYGAKPQFILSSATLANPLELANKLTGEEFVLVDNDTSPSGEKDFILYNPFKNYRRRAKNATEAPSVHLETERIFLYLMLKQIQTLCFTVSRKTAELIARWSKHDMNQIKPKWTERIAAYRAGYLAEERRDIENKLKSGEYLGVTCTNALEMGIDIGSLDAVVISGFPGTMISTWQQSGRAGRSNQKSLAILVAFENQLDQYFMNNPKFFFDKPHENAIIDLNNNILRDAHLACAAYELPITIEEGKKYFGVDKEILDKFSRDRILRRTPQNQYIYNHNDNPAFNHSLDQLSNETFMIMNRGKVLETMDRSQMYREAHEGAILINKGETYRVENINFSKKIVNVVKEDVDYHTMVLHDTAINIDKKISKTRYGNLTINFGELTVTEDYYKYKLMQYSKVLGVNMLDLKPLKFKTKGLWFTVPEDVKNAIEKEFPEDESYPGGLHGAEHALIGLFPLHVMCDRFDIGGLSTDYHPDTQEASVFIYDAYEGGMGITEKAADVFVDLLKSTRDLLENCDCKEGCPSCIYSPKCGNDNKPLNKNTTKYIIDYLLSQVEDEEGVKEIIVEEKPNKKEIIHKPKIKKVEKPKKPQKEPTVNEEDILYEEAYDLYVQEDYFLAKDILNDIIAKNSRYADAYALLGRILYRQGDKSGAVMFTKKALSIDSANEMASELLFELEY
ncbi:MAG: DEAD/DEAH box helicase [Methanobrevibacter sp.]|uniref:DEAD/DEAH box helicase n=1 Tax=Methanobrevibacter sp. TaxID=66852 RepID=UPI0026DEC1B2|nr:DEAD/DEAH box helicase [Methanobrevibacter sp.]MDO5849230.1 DEAD/DEAH box helicase [Methanobrevibacter sp.]